MAQFNFSSDSPLNNGGPIPLSQVFINSLRSAGASDAEIQDLINDPEAQKEFSIQVARDPFGAIGVGRQLYDGYRAKAKEKAATQNAPVDPREAERGNLTKWITEFTQSMGRPVDMNDPVFASLSNMGSARASMGVGQSGIRVGRGGLGEAAIQQGANAAVTPYLQQRQSMYQQGLGMLDSRQRGIEQLQQGAYGLNLQQQQMRNGINQQQYGQAADAAGGAGGIWGGVLGGLAGAGLAAATGGATAAAIPGMIQGGSQLGAGIGAGGVQRPQYQSPRPYGSFGGGGRSSGGGY